MIILDQDKHQKALLESVLEVTPALVAVMDTDGRVVRFNRASEDLTGWSFEEIEGRRLWEFLVPADEREAVQRVFGDLSAGHFPSRHVNDWLTRQGERRTIEWSNTALLDEDGEVVYVVATGIDITLRRQAEQTRDAQRADKDKFWGIIDLSADAILSIDADQRITLFNKGAEEIFGYTAEEMLGEPLSVLLPPEARAVHVGLVNGFAEAPQAAQRMGERGQIYGRRKNGEIFPAEASISKQQIDGGRLFTAVLRDVTDQRRAEAALEQANVELRRSNAELEHFAAVASHDLQEPLRKIQAFGDRLASKFGDDLPERGQDYLGRMQNAAGRMSELIQDLLVFSRVTTKARPFRPVELGRVAEQVVSDLQTRIERTGGSVELGELPTIDADETQIRQLLQNLVGNALKFHRPGVAPVVTVAAEPAADADGRQLCQLSVTDNGVGFDEKYLDRIFDVFQRLHGRGVYEGTGMGLAICRKIVERHGGTITATSRPEAGSRFVVSLPVHQAQSERNQQYSEASHAE